MKYRVTQTLGHRCGHRETQRYTGTYRKTNIITERHRHKGTQAWAQRDTARHRNGQKDKQRDTGKEYIEIHKHRRREMQRDTH